MGPRAPPADVDLPTADTSITGSSEAPRLAPVPGAVDGGVTTFITDMWTYEISVGATGDDEPAVAAAREVEEETGWRPGPLRPLIYTQPTQGLMNSEHHVFRADSAEYIGPPVDGFKSERVEWVPLATSAV